MSDNINMVSFTFLTVAIQKVTVTKVCKII